MSNPQVVDDKVWCPLCKEYVQLIKISNATRLVNVHRRTVYRYIDQGLIYAVKIVGKSYRVCGNCLFRQDRS
jgi:excisionase family DNA binding protein